MKRPGNATTKVDRQSKQSDTASNSGLRIFELRTYQLKVGVAHQYVSQFEAKGLPVISQYCDLIGYWIVETGSLNKVVHLWSYESFEHRRDARARLSRDPAWRDEYIPLAAQMIVSQDSVIMSAAQFSPLR